MHVLIKGVNYFTRDSKWCAFYSRVYSNLEYLVIAFFNDVVHHF